MEKMDISAFGRAWPGVIDRLPAGGLLITRAGRPVARVTELPEDPRALIGSVPDLRFQPGDNLLSTGLCWDGD
ncbi:MAG: hypothetical protein ACTHJX_15125 [Terriglobales bacterium]